MREIKEMLEGGFPVWALPSDARGASVARGIVKQSCAAIGIDEDVAYDAAVAISELASNVYVHARGGPVPPEIWAYLRWDERPELVLKVFDSAPWRGVQPNGERPEPTATGGRGFEVVQALTAEHGGTWGIHRTVSRLTARPVLGKAVYLTVPHQVEAPPSNALETAVRLHDLLEERRLGRLQASYGYEMAVICVRPGVHVWVRGTSIACHLSGLGTTRVPLSDFVEITERIVRHCVEAESAPSATAASARTPPSAPPVRPE